MTDFHERVVALAITLPLTMQDIVLWCTELGKKTKISKNDALSLLEGLKGDPESMELIMERSRNDSRSRAADPLRNMGTTFDRSSDAFQLVLQVVQLTLHWLKPVV